MNENWLRDLAPETMTEGSIDNHVWSYVKDDPTADDQLYTQERRVEMAREKVRKIRHYEPGSPEWFQLADHLQDLSGLAKIEVFANLHHRRRWQSICFVPSWINRSKYRLTRLKLC